MSDGSLDRIDHAIKIASLIAGISTFLALNAFFRGETRAIAGICSALEAGYTATATQEPDAFCGNSDARLNIISQMLFLSSALIGYGVFRFVKGVVFWRGPEAKSKT